ncbi:MAG: ParB/RepB/Spo0J family partition protein [Alphaproteobacteria bacterium]
MNSDDHKRKQLGRGLSALLGDEMPPRTEQGAEKSVRTLPLTQLRPGSFQPRRRFDEQELDSLAHSIKEKGVLQPILVRPLADQEYEIVAGERRWRAAQRAGIHDIPVIVRELSDRDVLEIALVENIQRADLSPIEEAFGYRRLMTEFGHTQDHLAQIIGKSRSHIANAVRLLDLSTAIQLLIDEKKLSPGHARPLIGLPNAETLARIAVSRDMSVRQVEAMARNAKDPQHGKTQSEKNTDVAALENQLSGVLGLKVGLKTKGTAGELTIRYQSLEQLDDLVLRLTHTHHT